MPCCWHSRITRLPRSVQAMARTPESANVVIWKPDIGRAQNTAEDWRLGSFGCYDAPSLARLQTTLRLDFGAVARGNLAACLARPLDAGIQRALCDETRRACPDALARLMADHTQVEPRACAALEPVSPLG